MVNHTSNAKHRKIIPKKRGGNIRTPAMRLQAKEVFLQTYAQTKSTKEACDAAGISRGAVKYWLLNGFLTQQELIDAELDHQDGIRKLTHQWAFEGIKTRVRDSHGNPLNDENGFPLFEYRRSERLAAKWIDTLPEFKGLAQNGNTHPVSTIGSTLSADNTLVIDGRFIEPEEIPDLRRIGTIIEQRSATAINNGWRPETGESPVPYYSGHVVVNSTNEIIASYLDQTF
jgi:hypothetical protein